MLPLVRLAHYPTAAVNRGFAMSDNFIWPVSSAIAVGLLALMGNWLRLRAREARDRRTIFRWLQVNTRDKPGHSHVDTTTLAKGTGLAEDRVRAACMSDRRIHRTPDGLDRWSIWREEEQSIYEERGIFFL